MTTVTISQARARVDEQVRVKAWVDTVRDQKSMQFVILRDATGMVQVALWKKGNPDLAETISTLAVESVVEIEGKVVANESVRLGGVEIQLETMTVHSAAAPMLPIEEDSAQDVRMDWRFIDLRRPRNRLIFEVQTVAEHAMRDFWMQERFIEIHSPKLMGAPSESGAELFALEYFGGQAYLAQSPQFYKQMAMAAGFDRVFEIGSVFRADPSFTSRHATEFVSIDMEFSWLDTHDDVMQMEERWLAHTISAVKDQLGPQIEEVFGVELVVPELPFPRVPMAQAREIVAAAGHELPDDGKDDLDPEGERIMGRYAKEKFGHDFVFVTDYPWSVRPFYHMKHPDDPNLTRSFDLLWNGLEVTTGAQREHRLDVLIEQLYEKGLTEGPLQFYLDFFKYGCPPHGCLGFGLGRMLMSLLGLPNLREATFLFRGPHRLMP
ncbi:MAG: aspartate--tRNA(Asn) ligase [Anaerolineae bacterium]|nr:aspartate--tRNA(Asn) ligase [Anaerolineae bacterium]